MSEQSNNKASVKELKAVKANSNAVLPFMIVDILLNQIAPPGLTISEITAEILQRGFCFSRVAVWHTLKAFPKDTFSNLNLVEKIKRVGVRKVPTATYFLTFKNQPQEDAY